MHLDRLGRHRRLFIAAFALVVMGALVPLPAAASNASPRGVVQSYYAKLVGVLRQASALGFKGRYDALSPTIAQTFDIEFITRVAVGFRWRKLSEDQRTRLVAAMQRLNTATYAARFRSYAGEKFEVLGERKTSRGDVLVMTQIVKSDGEKVKINYLLRNRSGDWRIIDVHLKGTISELAKWRAEFGAVLQSKGYDGLMAAIENRITALGAA